MSRSGRRAAVAALVAALTFGTEASLAAQQPAAAATQDPAPPAGPRVAPAMHRVEPTLAAPAASPYAPMKKKDTTVITISTLGIILILVVLILLLA